MRSRKILKIRSEVIEEDGKREVFFTIYGLGSPSTRYETIQEVLIDVQHRLNLFVSDAYSGGKDEQKSAETET